MSIIYDALKKTQKAHTIHTIISVPKKSKKLYSVITLFFLIFIFLLSLGWLYRKSLFVKPAPPPPVIVKVIKRVPHVKLILNGVFISDDEKIAVINNKNYHLNEQINDMTIESIDLSGVKLKNEKTTIYLKT